MNDRAAAATGTDDTSNPADTLFAGLKATLSGNFVDDHQIVESSRRTERYSIRLDVTWQFQVLLNEEDDKGNPGVDGYQHFGSDAAAYAQAISALKQQGMDDHDAQSGFMQQQAALGESGLAHADLDRYDLKHLGRLSYHFDCEPCDGAGKLPCQHCNGRGSRPCTDCNGYGTRYVSEIRYVTDGSGRSSPHTVTVGKACFCLLGRVACQACASAGKVTCRTCDGNQFFTRRGNVTLCAVPAPRIRYQEGLGHQELLELLQRTPRTDYPKRMSYQPSGSSVEPRGANEWGITYSFVATVTQLNIQVKGAPFDVLALGRKDLTLLTRPPIFDSLFEPALAQWGQVKQLPAARRAHQIERYFQTLQTAVLPAALLKASGSERQLDESLTKVRDTVCRGLISNACLGRLVAVIKRTMHVMSPQYSEAVWSGFMLVPWLLTFLAVHVTFEQYDRELGSVAFAVQVVAWMGLTALVLVLIAAIFAHPFSVYACRKRQRSIPQSLRRRPLFIKPLVKHWKQTAMIMACGIVTGLLFRYLDVHYGLSLIEWIFKAVGIQAQLT